MIINKSEFAKRLTVELNDIEILMFDVGVTFDGNGVFMLMSPCLKGAAYTLGEDPRDCRFLRNLGISLGELFHTNRVNVNYNPCDESFKFSIFIPKSIFEGVEWNE